MMKRFKLFLALFLFVCVFGFLMACEKKEEGTKTQTQTKEPTTVEVVEPVRDVDYPRDLPTFSEDSIQIHYYRSDGKYSKWTLWLWDPSGDDDQVEDDFNYQDDFGVIAYYPLSKFGSLDSNILGLIVKTKGSWTKDGGDADRLIDFTALEKDSNNVYHVYLFGGDINIYLNKDKTVPDSVTLASFTDEKTIKVNCSNNISEYEIYEDDNLLIKKEETNKSFTYVLDKNADLTKSYKVVITFSQSGAKLSKGISFSSLYDSETFINLFNYDGELGAIYTKDATTFKVWSPVSSKILLRLYENGTPTSVSATLGNDSYQEFEMVKGDKGVFSYTVEKDLHGTYYTYVVYNSEHENGTEIVDPYAKGAGVNGLRGLVVDFERTNPDGWAEVNYLDYDRKSLVVWETHVADVTSSNTWGGSKENQRKYLGLIEEGTTYTSGPMTVTTGFDHIKELGVNAVQLLPIFDQANDEVNYSFNWGYNPLNYNVVEGVYSNDPYDGLVRINELKQVVMAFNKAGITTIMDVVYNHVNGAKGSNFDVLMPYYYFRYNSDGSLSNGSGCGNEVASERVMVRKFIVDSCKFWCEEYKLGGFRFDLMGLIDLDTMEEVTKEVTKINEHACIYGEPWQGGSSPLSSSLAATQANGNKYNGYGAFNDKFRDALIKGGLNAASSKGWINNTTVCFASDVTAIEYGINGKTYLSTNSINDPNKNVIYVTCHDNYTLYDRIKASGITDNATVKQMAQLAQSLVLTSNGTCFMLAGEEMLRTKGGDSNSYKSSDNINCLNYGLKITNYDLFENIKWLINFKINTSGLQMDEANIDVIKLAGGGVLQYEVSDGSDTYIIIHSNGYGEKPEIDLSEYEIVYNSQDEYDGVIKDYQTVIAKK